MCRLLEILRSLNSEHVLFSDLIQNERERRTSSGCAFEKAERDGVSASDGVMIAVARKWFWSRKMGGGFVLQGFPGNLAQAMVFDEWLEARGETLNEVFQLIGPGAADSQTELVVEYFEGQSILTRIASRDLVRSDQMSEALEVAVLP